MKNKKYNYGFKKRTLFYGIFGLICVFIDAIIFFLFINFMNPLYANTLAYISGSSLSFVLNRKYTFKSKISKLSPIRFFLIVGTGFLVSQIIIWIGTELLALQGKLHFIKSTAIIFSISLQYSLNSIVGNVAKRE